MSDWSVRPYRAGDERELVALFQRVFGRAITQAHWCWKLLAPDGSVANVWLAVHDDAPIFQYAGIPARIQMGTDDRSVMISVDTMTAPEYQRRGLLTEVGQITYAHWREAGVALVLGLPNDRWGSRTRALGWIDLFPLQWLTRPLRPTLVLAQRLHAPAVARLRVLDRLWNGLWDRTLQYAPRLSVRALSEPEPVLDRLWASCRRDDEFTLVRDSAWLRWRYFAPPALRYTLLLAERDDEPLGYLAYRLSGAGGRKVGLIAELFTRRDEVSARAMLIRHALAQMRQADAELVSVLSVPHTTLHQTFRRAGFLPRDAFRVEMAPLDTTLPIDRLRYPQRWCIAGGDFDVV